jgi:N6-adenosine-specific RNA methylase IME4
MARGNPREDRGMKWPFGDLKPFGFDLVMADPPWDFITYSSKGQAKGPGGHYPVMALDEIKRMPVGHLMAQDAVLWLWATHPMLPDQIDVMQAWGVRFVTSGVWVKRTVTGKLAFGTGYRLRCASEPFLIGTNGNPATARTVRTVIEGQQREHSRKPDEAFAAAEELVPGGRYAEIFSRQSRSGWSAWGDEATKFDPPRSSTAPAGAATPAELWSE